LTYQMLSGRRRVGLPKGCLTVLPHHYEFHVLRLVGYSSRLRPSRRGKANLQKYKTKTSSFRPKWRNLVTKDSHFCALTRSLDFARDDRSTSLDMTKSPDGSGHGMTTSNKSALLLREAALPPFVAKLLRRMGCYEV
jgi:hypothetical protein